MGKKDESRYTLSRFLKSLSLSVANGYAVQSLDVNAFIKVLRDLRIIIKNGSLTGYFLDPQSAVCSNMCATPVESSGIVLKATINTFSSLLESK